MARKKRTKKKAAARMTRYRNQERYAERNRDDRGLVKVCVWIPEAARDSVLSMAERLRKRAKRAG